MVSQSVNAVSMGTLSFAVNSIVVASDSIKITFPSSLGLSALTQVVMTGNVVTNNPIVSAGSITLTGLNAYPSQTVQVQLSNIMNPPSEQPTAIFAVQTSRNSFLIETLQASLTYSATRTTLVGPVISANSL